MQNFHPLSIANSTANKQALASATSREEGSKGKDLKHKTEPSRVLAIALAIEEEEETAASKFILIHLSGGATQAKDQT